MASVAVLAGALALAAAVTDGLCVGPAAPAAAVTVTSQVLIAIPPLPKEEEAVAGLQLATGHLLALASAAAAVAVAATSCG
jgi:hypothetical protein